MRTIISVLLTIGFFTLFSKGNLGLFGLLFGALVIWNLIGGFIDYRRNR